MFGRDNKEKVTPNRRMNLLTDDEIVVFAYVSTLVGLLREKGILSSDDIGILKRSTERVVQRALQQKMEKEQGILK